MDKGGVGEKVAGSGAVEVTLEKINNEIQRIEIRRKDPVAQSTTPRHSNIQDTRNFKKNDLNVFKNQTLGEVTKDKVNRLHEPSNESSSYNSDLELQNSTRILQKIGQNCL